MPPNNPGAPYPPMQPGQVPPMGQPVMPGQNPMMPMGKPKKHSHIGWILALVLTILLLIGAVVFGVWAFMERGTYKNDTDAIVAKEVEIAKQETSTAKDAEFIEKEKSPYQNYETPSQYGSVNITYPKTWSAFVTEGKGTSPIDGYFHPNFVPGIDSGTAFALRIKVTNTPYDQELKKFDTEAKQGKVRVSPYRAAKVPDVLGARIDGEINTGQKDSMVMLPLRDKTVMIWTESESFLKDFNEVVLPNLTFTP